MAPSVGLDRSRIDRALGGLIEIAEAGPANRCFPDRVTERLGICLKTGPAHQLRADGRVTSYPANAICVRPPGCIWSVAATGPVGFISIDLAPSLLPAGIPRGAGMAFAPRDTEALPDIVRLASALRTNRSDPDGEERALDLVLAVERAGLLSADELRQTAPDRTSARVREAIEGALAHPPPLAWLARDLGISRFALLRCFKRDFGVTPHVYVLRRRVDRARERIARGGELIEVAQEVGFADQAHMTRVFKRIVGLTPGAYAGRARSRGATRPRAPHFRSRRGGRSLQT
jgi:AraC-like DNA-binding protein